MHRLLPAQNGAYALMTGAAIALGAAYWYARSRRRPELLIVYIGAIGGAFLGAKLAYILAESWFDRGRPDFWLRLATGKSILGGLLGGYAGVEWAKKLSGQSQSTGDAFALVLPLGLLMGRVGCLLHGCCLGAPVAADFPLAMQDQAGAPRWPAVPVEMGFLAAMAALMIWCACRGLFRDRRFFLFLAMYGLFRFAHEWLRDTPKWWGVISGYQIIALAMMGTGVVMFVRRGREAGQKAGREP